MASKVPYTIAFACYIVSFIFGAVGFGTGYWYVAKGENRLFTRLGLWEACFNGYEHTSDYIGKAYFGCWWIFHKEYSYIRDWLLPSWFVAVQTLTTLGLVLQMLGLALFPGAGRENDNANRETLVSVITGLCFTCLTIAVVVFGTMIGEDRTWMPRYDINEPGWSYGLVVISGFFAIFSCISITVYMLMRRWDIEEDRYRNSKKPIPMLPRI